MSFWYSFLVQYFHCIRHSSKPAVSTLPSWEVWRAQALQEAFFVPHCIVRSAVQCGTKKEYRTYAVSVAREVWRDFVPPRIFFSALVGGKAADQGGKGVI